MSGLSFSKKAAKGKKIDYIRINKSMGKGYPDDPLILFWVCFI
jgi:hypothetical protein